MPIYGGPRGEFRSAIAHFATIQGAPLMSGGQSTVTIERGAQAIQRRPREAIVLPPRPGAGCRRAAARPFYGRR